MDVIQAFFDALAQTAARIQWRVERDNYGHIRGTWQNDRGYTLTFCPLTAVHWAKTRTHERLAMYREVGVQFGLKVETADAIASSADDRDGVYRARILAALGLTEELPNVRIKYS